jgi:WD40 repeat protein
MTGAQAGSPAVAPSNVVALGGDISCLAAVDGAATVVAGLADGTVAAWNGRDGAPGVVLKPHSARVLAVGPTSDGDVWSVAADGTLARTRLAAGASPTQRRLDLGAAPTRAAVFSSDAARLTCGGEKGEIRVFDTASGALWFRLRGHRTELQEMAARPGSALVASASAEADLKVWDTSAGREVAAVEGDLSLFALAFSPRDGTLAAGGVDRRVTFRDPSSLEARGEFASAPRMVAALAWSPDGADVALGDIDEQSLSKGSIRVIDAARRAVLAVLDTGGAPVGRLAFLGGVVVAAIGRDLRAWPVDANSR